MGTDPCLQPLGSLPGCRFLCLLDWRLRLSQSWLQSQMELAPLSSSSSSLWIAKAKANMWSLPSLRMLTRTMRR